MLRFTVGLTEAFERALATLIRPPPTPVDTAETT
jgi:hypothetical protein